MFVLETTSKSLLFKLQGAVTTNALAFTCSYVEIKPDDGTPATFIGGNNSGLSNNMTGVTLLAAPAAGKTRQLKNVTIINLDTVNSTVTIYELDGVDIRPLLAINLDIGDHVHFDDGNGWKVITSTGSPKLINPATVTAAQNVGLGTGWFKILSGTTLEFKTIVLASNKLSVVSNANDLTLDVVPGNIDITTLGGYKIPVIGEIPSGTVNGINNTFMLANTPTAGTLELYKNGLIQIVTNDYIIAGLTITFNINNIPSIGDNLVANYDY